MRDKLARIVDGIAGRLNRVVEIAIAVLIAIMVTVIFVQVLSRYVWDFSLSWSEELARYSFIWVIFLGCSSAMRHSEHLSIDGVASFLPARLAYALQYIVAIVNSAFFLVVLYTGWILVDNAIPQISTGLGISVGWVYLAAPIGAVLTLIHLVNTLLRGFSHEHSAS